MTNGVDAAIESLKAKFSARNDAELARRFGIDKSTISTWRRRGRVPDRYASLLLPTKTGEVPRVFVMPMQWTDSEKAAFKVALFRYLDEAAGAAGDFPRMVRVASGEATHIWARAAEAFQELGLRTQPGMSADEVAALIMYEDLNPPKD